MGKFQYGNCLLDMLTLPTAETLSARLNTIADAEWPALLQQMGDHRIAPTLWQRLLRFGLTDQIPDAAKQLWQDRLHYLTAYNLRLFHAQGQLLDICKREDIPVLVMKGAHLAHTVYEHSRLRPMTDLDLLFHKQDLDRVRKILLDLGYQNEPGDYVVEEQVAKTDAHHLPPFISPGMAKIEVHWNLVDSQDTVTPDLPGIWERKQAFTVNGRRMYGLAPEDMLLYLAVHGLYVHQCQIGLHAFVDIDLVIRAYQDQLDWQQVVALADQWRAAHTVALALRLAQKFVGTPVPQFVYDELDPAGSVESWVEVSQSVVLAEIQHVEEAQRASIIMTGKLSQQTDFGGKLRFFFQKLFPSPSELADIYPWVKLPGAIYLLYTVHWLRKLMLYGQQYMALVVRGLMPSENGHYIRMRYQRAERTHGIMNWLRSE